MQRDLQDLGQVEVARQRIGLVTPAARLHAARRPAAARVGQALAGRQQLVDDLLGAVEGRLAPSGARHLAGAQQEAARRLARDLHVGVRLDEHHLVHAVQDEVGHLVHAVGAIGRDAAGVDVGEIAVRAALFERHAHLGRRGLVVELHPQAFQQLERTVAVERAGRHVGAVVADEMLVEAAGRVGVPRVRLARDGQVDEPVALDPLPERLRALGRDDAAVLGDLGQLGGAHGIGLVGRHGARQLCVADGQHLHALERDKHARELVALGHGVLVGQVVEARQRGLDVCADLAEARAHAALGAQAGVPAGALLVELGEDACLVGVVPGGLLRAHDGVAARAARPVRDHDVALCSQVVLGDGEVDLLAVVHVVHVLERVAAQLGEGGRRLRAATLFAHDELARLDGDALVREVVAQHQAAQLRDGDRALVAQVGRRLDERALHVEVGLGGLGLMAQALHALVHAAVVLPRGMRRGARRRLVRAHRGERVANRLEARVVERGGRVGLADARRLACVHGDLPRIGIPCHINPRFPPARSRARAAGRAGAPSSAPRAPRTRPTARRDPGARTFHYPLYDTAADSPGTAPHAT